MRDLRLLNRIVLHHSASDNPDHDNLATIREWHLARGFDMEGYHYFIRKNGIVEIGRPVVMEGAHCYGHNKNSIGICMSGKDEFSKEQFTTCAKICINLMHAFPNLTMFLHKELAATECPNFTINDIQSRINKILEIT